jgi:lipoprotein-anchoring transpeptidase ErfK/SrfK
MRMLAFLLLSIPCLLPAVASAGSDASPSPAADVQILLDRVGFSPGVIDGQASETMRKALAAFQEAHDLPATGETDSLTMDNLRAAAGSQVFVRYAITARDAAGPFVPIPKELERQARLPALGYSSLLELLAERFHSTPELLRELNPQARFTAGETLRVPAVRSVSAATRPSSHDVRVVVSQSKSSLTVDNGDDLLFYAPVSAGSERDPLPVGRFEVKAIVRNPVFRDNPHHFWDPDPRHARLTLPAGPNNPVGLAWIDLTKEHYGLQGTPEPQQIGQPFQRGCVRMTNWDVLTVASLVRPGTPVIFEP